MNHRHTIDIHARGSRSRSFWLLGLLPAVLCCGTEDGAAQGSVPPANPEPVNGVPPAQPPLSGGASEPGPVVVGEGGGRATSSAGAPGIAAGGTAPVTEPASSGGAAGASASGGTSAEGGAAGAAAAGAGNTPRDPLAICQEFGVAAADCKVPEVTRQAWRTSEYASYRGPKVSGVAAELGCALLNMKLVRIDDQEENDFIADFALNAGSRDEGCETVCTWHCDGANACDQKGAWIGARDRAEEGVWRWDIDGDAFWRGNGVGRQPAGGKPEPGIFANWAEGGGNGGQPNEEENNELENTWEDCALIRDDKVWWDVGCENRRGWFVCEQPLAP